MHRRQYRTILLRSRICASCLIAILGSGPAIAQTQNGGAPGGGAASSTAAGVTWPREVYAELGLGALVPTSSAVNGIGSGWMVVAGGGWWRPPFRLGLSFESGQSGACASCWPGGPAWTVGASGRVRLDVWASSGWAVSAGVDSGIIAAHQTSGAGTSIYSIGAGMSLDHSILRGASRLQGEVIAQEWLGGNASSPAIGFRFGILCCVNP